MEMNAAVETATITAPHRHRFSPEDVRWASAWAEVAPGLGGWGVSFAQDAEPGNDAEPGESGQVLFAYPPSPMRGLGTLPREPWAITATAEGVLIGDSDYQDIAAPTLRDALLIVCPLSPDQMAEADALAALDDDEG